MSKKTSLLKKIMQGSLVSSAIVGNTIVNGSIVASMGVCKIFNSSRKIDEIMLNAANRWVSNNNWLIEHTLPQLAWDIYIDPNLDLKLDGHYMMISNHQSWIDTTVNQYFVRHRMPFTRFFIKHELIYLPVAGQAFKALGYPTMKRHSKNKITKNPNLKNRDLLEAQKSCERLLNHHFTLLNYLEGTRFTVQKHQQQQSPYQHLLKPKAGGLALSLHVLGKQLDALVDMTIVYEDNVPSYSTFWLGETKIIRVHVRKINVPDWVLQGNYQQDNEYRQKFQTWVDEIWQQKDNLIQQIKVQRTAQIEITSLA